MKGKGYLTKPRQFASVYNEGKSWVSRVLVMKVLPNGLDYSRYGFSLSRHVGGALTRNRVKRVLREILRPMPLQEGWDIVFIARSPASASKYAQLRESVEALLYQAQLLMRNDEKVCLKTN